VTRRPALLLALAALAACDNPVGYQTDHLEAVEVVVLDASGAELARTVENRRWVGPAAEAGLAVPAGGTLALRVRFVTLEGDEVPVTARAGLTLRVEWEPEGLVVHEPLGERDELHGLRPGTTTLRLLAWHGSHADFISPPLDVTVTAPAP
jgi:hypothetical protein